MAWTAPTTFVSGNVLTAAQMNTNVRDNTNFLHSPPGCLAQRTTNQSINNAVATNASFTGTDIYDTDTMHDPAGAPTDITINTAGIYAVWCSVQFAANATGVRRLIIIISAGGMELAGTQDTGPTAGVNSMLTTTAQVKLAASPPTLNAVVDQTSGGALNLIGNANSTTTFTGGVAGCQFGAQWISDGT